MTTPRSEPVSALATDAAPSFAERMHRAFERMIDRILFSGNIGSSTLRRSERKRRAGDDDGALALIRAVAVDDEVSPTIAAVARVLEAYLHLARGDDEAAERIMARVVETDLTAPSTRLQFLLVRASLTRGRGDYEAMLRDADAALAIAPVKGAHFFRALALKNLARMDDAVAALDAALAAAPSDALAHVVRAGYGVLAGEDGARARLDAAFANTKLTRPDATTWRLNQAWAAAITGDDDGVFRALVAATLDAAPTVLGRVRRYIDMEADLARLRNDARMDELCHDLDRRIRIRATASS